MTTTAAKLLQNTLAKLSKEPVEGFVCEILDNDLFKWKIYLEGPKDSPYEGGIFQLEMDFPTDFPMAPPSLRFISQFWHPNVYEDGRVCISILHPPGEDPMSGELPEERWLPTQSVSTILLSVISMLNDPNISSPANVNASVQWRKERDIYNKKCRELAEKAKNQAPSDLKIPHPDSDPLERQKTIEKMKEVEVDDFDMYSYGDDFEDDDGGEEDEEDLEMEDDGSGEEEGGEEITKKEAKTTTTTTKKNDEQEEKEEKGKENESYNDTESNDKEHLNKRKHEKQADDASETTERDEVKKKKDLPHDDDSSAAKLHDLTNQPDLSIEHSSAPAPLSSSPSSSQSPESSPSSSSSSSGSAPTSSSVDSSDTKKKKKQKCSLM